MPLPRSLSVDLQNAYLPAQQLLTALLPIQKPTSKRMNCQQQAQAQGSHWLGHVPIVLKQLSWCNSGRASSVMLPCPTARAHGFRNQGKETGVELLTITSSEPLPEFLLPVPMTLFSASPEISLPKGGMLLSRDGTMIPLNWRMRLPLHTVGSLCLSINRQWREWLCWLAWLSWWPRRNYTAILQQSLKKSISEIQKIPWSVSQYNHAVRSVNGKLTIHFRQDYFIKPRPFKNALVTPTRKEPWQAEILAKGKWSME